LKKLKALGTNPEESFCSNCQFKKLAASDQFIGESRNTLWREINQNFYIALLE
jgi:hypothetical protein